MLPGEERSFFTGQAVWGPKSFPGSGFRAGFALLSPRSKGFVKIVTYKGAITTLYVEPPADSVVVCLDEMGPEAAKSHPGPRLVKALPTAEQPAERAKQKIDYGRLAKGYIYGAFRPATGEAFTATFTRRALEYWSTFLEQVSWIGSETERIYAVLDNLSMHRAADVLLFSLTHPRWEYVFQPTYATYLNLIEPWWKTLRSLALKGRRFENWQEIVQAVEKATAYGMPIAIPLCGDDEDAISRADLLALLWSPLPALLSGCTI